MAQMPFNSARDTDEFRKEITRVGLQWGRPIWWYDWQQPFEKLRITGASCFVLKFKTGYIGVTAAHVVNELIKARCHTSSLACLIQLTHLNILNAIIDMNDNLDIATFRISEEKIRTSGAQAFDVSSEWPPQIQIKRQMPIQLVGFPECLRKIDYAGGSVNCAGYQALALVEDYNDREIIVIYDPEQSRGSPKLLPLGFNLSGCSGGPAVIHHTRNAYIAGILSALYLVGRSDRAKATLQATIRSVFGESTTSIRTATYGFRIPDGYHHRSSETPASALYRASQAFLG
jgi:hypothetical protein